MDLEWGPKYTAQAAVCCFNRKKKKKKMFEMWILNGWIVKKLSPLQMKAIYRKILISKNSLVESLCEHTQNYNLYTICILNTMESTNTKTNFHSSFNWIHRYSSLSVFSSSFFHLWSSARNNTNYFSRWNINILVE